ncbi:hypothetical protein ACFQH6_20685 [Halobacteriaceae archaeon GCM10025711]
MTPPYPGPPDFVDVPDVADLEDKLATRTPPYKIAFTQGESEVVEEFESADTSRGAQIAELHYSDGRYVTVDVERELLGVRA